ncbi:hypothetical protein AgCh_003577 [Apium graveolens]
MRLVHDQFDGSSFSNWKRSMSIAISARNKLGALSKSISRSVSYCDSAHHMWCELEERYGVSNGAQLFGL